MFTLLVYLIFCHIFASRLDQLRSEYKFIVKRHLIINGLNELIWLSEV